MIKKSGVYFDKAQIVRDVKGAVEAVMRAEGSQQSCVRAGGSQKSRVRADGLQNPPKSCVRVEGLQNSCVRVEAYGLKDCKIHKIVKLHAYELKDCKSVKNHALSFRITICPSTMTQSCKPVVEDPVDDDRILAEAEAGMIPAPCERSESEKMNHKLTHIPFQPWCTSCIKDKAQG